MVYSQSLDQFGRETVVRIAHFVRIAESRLHQHAVLDVNVERVFGGDRMLFVRWQQLEYHVGEQIGEATRILHNCFGERVVVLLQIVQIDDNGDLLAMRYAGQLGRIFEELDTVLVCFAVLGQKRFDCLCWSEILQFINCSSMGRHV